MKMPMAARALAVLSGLLALGCGALAVGHAGVDVPLVSRLGPGGSNAVWPAAIAFAVAAAVMTTVAVGAVRVKPWAWALGLVAHALTFMGAAMPYRGVGSLLAMIVSAVAVVFLLSRPGRDAFVGQRASATS